MREYFYRELQPPYATIGPFSEGGPQDLIKGDMPMSVQKDSLLGPVAKCIRACETQDFTDVSKGEIDSAIDIIVADEAREKNISFAQAYTEFMLDSSGVGKLLYSARESLLEKRDDVSKAADADEEKERAAEDFAKSYNVDMATARRQVREYYQK